jgi:bifunctional non-homologous end joining protein LigD
MPRRPSAPLPDFIEPQLAQLVDRAPEGDAWLHEVKIDGYRVAARIERGDVRMLKRVRAWGMPGSPEMSGKLRPAAISAQILSARSSE